MSLIKDLVTVVKSFTPRGCVLQDIRCFRHLVDARVVRSNSLVWTLRWAMDRMKKNNRELLAKTDMEYAAGVYYCEVVAYTVESAEWIPFHLLPELSDDARTNFVPIP